MANPNALAILSGLFGGAQRGADFYQQQQARGPERLMSLQEMLLQQAQRDRAYGLDVKQFQETQKQHELANALASREEERRKLESVALVKSRESSALAAQALVQKYKKDAATPKDNRPTSVKEYDFYKQQGGTLPYADFKKLGTAPIAERAGIKAVIDAVRGNESSYDYITQDQYDDLETDTERNQFKPVAGTPEKNAVYRRLKPGASTILKQLETALQSAAIESGAEIEDSTDADAILEFLLNPDATSFEDGQ